MTEGASHGLYHCVNSGYTTWLELARELRAILDRPTPTETGCLAVEVRLRATRPLFAALSNAKLTAAGIAMPDWRSALVAHARRRTGSLQVSRD